MKRVLCVDGGGIRGLMPATFLERLERHYDERVARMFDMIAGTSTGGLIALFLSVPGQRNRDYPAHSAQQLRILYQEHADTIFPARWMQGARSLWSPRHRVDGLRHIVTDRLRDWTINQCVTHAVVPAFDRSTGEDAVFKTGHVVDWLCRDVALATSAAPTYFPAHEARSEGRESHGSFIDGGVWANNPALCAYAEAKRKWPGEKIRILSLGTGRRNRRNLGPESGGLLQWAPALADLFMDSGERGIDYQIRTLTHSLGDEYVRIQQDVPADLGMDVTDDQHLSLLVSLGHQMADDYLRSAA